MIIQNPNAPQLTAIPTTLDFGSTNSIQTLSIKNRGTGTLTWSAQVALIGFDHQS